MAGKSEKVERRRTSKQAGGNEAAASDGDATKKKRAAKGEGTPAGKLSNMLGILRYNAEFGKNQEKKRDAAEALKIYKALADPSDRLHFLSEFEANGNGKGPSGLKFASTFKMQLDGGQKTELATEENFMTRPIGAKIIDSKTLARNFKKKEMMIFFYFLRGPRS